MQLRRELSGIPGVIVRARPSGGQNNMMRGMGGGGGDGRLSIEILGHDLEHVEADRAGPQDDARHDARHRRHAPAA